MQQKSQDGVSVIICCYNSENRLRTTLKHLEQQVFNNQISWEIIVVNNLSKDNTQSIAESANSSFEEKYIQYKIVQQPIPGLIHAREKGIEEAQYNFLLFCDDDNWLSERYVETVYELMMADEKIGVLGGYGFFEPELPINTAIQALDSYYCNGQQEERAIRQHWVYGAGSTYRKNILLYLKEIKWQPITTGRKGKELISGDDIELCYMVYLLGFKIKASNKLIFKHFVPKQRQNIQYLLSLFYWIGYSSFLLEGYEMIMFKKEKNISACIRQLFWRNFKSLIKHNKTMFSYKFSTINIASINKLKIQIKVELGILRSILKNKSKIKAQFYHVTSVLEYHNKINVTNA